MPVKEESASSLEDKNHAVHSEFVKRVLQTTQKMKRMATIRKMPSGKYAAAENIVWEYISDQEMVKRYGKDVLRDRDEDELR